MIPTAERLGEKDEGDSPHIYWVIGEFIIRISPDPQLLLWGTCETRDIPQQKIQHLNVNADKSESHLPACPQVRYGGSHFGPTVTWEQPLCVLRNTQPRTVSCSFTHTPQLYLTPWKIKSSRTIELTLRLVDAPLRIQTPRNRLNSEQQ